MYKRCVRSAILYSSERWYLGQNEIGILQKTERAMVISDMCGMKLMDKNSTRDLMQMLDLNKTIEQLSRANSVRWHGNVFRKEKKNLLRGALHLKVIGTSKRGRPMKTWIKVVIEQSRKVGLSDSVANNHSRLRLGVNTIYSMMR